MNLNPTFFLLKNNFTKKNLGFASLSVVNQHFYQNHLIKKKGFDFDFANLKVANQHFYQNKKTTRLNQSTKDFTPKLSCFHHDWHYNTPFPFSFFIKNFWKKHVLVNFSRKTKILDLHIKEYRSHLRVASLPLIALVSIGFASLNAFSVYQTSNKRILPVLTYHVLDKPIKQLCNPIDHYMMIDQHVNFPYKNYQFFTQQLNQEGESSLENLIRYSLSSGFSHYYPNQVQQNLAKLAALSLSNIISFQNNCNQIFNKLPKDLFLLELHYGELTTISEISNPTIKQDSLNKFNQQNAKTYENVLNSVSETLSYDPDIYPSQTLNFVKLLKKYATVAEIYSQQFTKILNYYHHTALNKSVLYSSKGKIIEFDASPEAVKIYQDELWEDLTNYYTSTVEPFLKKLIRLKKDWQKILLQLTAESYNKKDLRSSKSLTETYIYEKFRQNGDLFSYIDLQIIYLKKVHQSFFNEQKDLNQFRNPSVLQSLVEKLLSNTYFKKSDLSDVEQQVLFEEAITPAEGQVRPTNNQDARQVEQINFWKTESDNLNYWLNEPEISNSPAASFWHKFMINFWNQYQTVLNTIYSDPYLALSGPYTTGEYVARGVTRNGLVPPISNRAHLRQHIRNFMSKELIIAKVYAPLFFSEISNSMIKSRQLVDAGNDTYKSRYNKYHSAKATEKSKAQYDKYKSRYNKYESRDSSYISSDSAPITDNAPIDENKEYSSSSEAEQRTVKPAPHNNETIYYTYKQGPPPSPSDFEDEKIAETVFKIPKTNLYNEVPQEEFSFMQGKIGEENLNRDNLLGKAAYYTESERPVHSVDPQPNVFKNFKLTSTNYKTMRDQNLPLIHQIFPIPRTGFHHSHYLNVKNNKQIKPAYLVYDKKQNDNQLLRFYNGRFLGDQLINSTPILSVQREFENKNYNYLINTYKLAYYNQQSYQFSVRFEPAFKWNNLIFNDVEEGDWKKNLTKILNFDSQRANIRLTRDPLFENIRTYTTEAQRLAIENLKSLYRNKIRDIMENYKKVYNIPILKLSNSYFRNPLNRSMEQERHDAKVFYQNIISPLLFQRNQTSANQLLFERHYAREIRQITDLQVLEDRLSKLRKGSQKMLEVSPFGNEQETQHFLNYDQETKFYSLSRDSRVYKNICSDLKNLEINVNNQTFGQIFDSDGTIINEEKELTTLSTFHPLVTPDIIDATINQLIHLLASCPLEETLQNLTAPMIATKLEFATHINESIRDQQNKNFLQHLSRLLGELDFLDNNTEQIPLAENQNQDQPPPTKKLKETENKTETAETETITKKPKNTKQKQQLKDLSVMAKLFELQSSLVQKTVIISPFLVALKFAKNFLITPT